MFFYIFYLIKLNERALDNQVCIEPFLNDVENLELNVYLLSLYFHHENLYVFFHIFRFMRATKNINVKFAARHLERNLTSKCTL